MVKPRATKQMEPIFTAFEEMPGILGRSKKKKRSLGFCVYISMTPWFGNILVPNQDSSKLLQAPDVRAVRCNVAFSNAGNVRGEQVRQAWQKQKRGSGFKVQCRNIGRRPDYDNSDNKESDQESDDHAGLDGRGMAKSTSKRPPSPSPSGRNLRSHHSLESSATAGECELEKYL